MSLTQPDRRVITFYSFKGGVGRTMALANIAFRLANTHGLNVIAVDWDLEAPGLHRYYGLSPEDAAKSRGVLDYLIAWREAVNGHADEPPSVGEWLLPIVDPAVAPRFGSVTLLTAGRLDEGYVDRLGAFNWKDFYRDDEGAAAVETLRDQLIARADVVLIDSRTGLTDAGGICTVQLPDGVVLMTAPNHQSLEGTERVARAITGASTEARAGRGRLRTWLSVSRVPSVDESYLADLWFTREDNQTWFDRGIELGLWSREDHHKGLRSHEIPYRARFGFDEALLSELAKIDPRDSLALAYEHLTGTLLTWLRGQPPIRLDLSDKPSVDIGRTSSVEDLRALATGAERRGDALGLALILHFLALALHESGHVDEAIRKVEQASGIYMSRGLRQEYGSSLLSLGLFLCTGSRLEEAEEAFLKVRGLARELTDTQMEARALNGLALVHVQRGVDKRSGLEFLEESDRLTRTFNPERRDPSLLALMGQVSHSLGNTKGAQEAMRQSMAIYRSLGDVTHEKIALSTILGFLDANQESEDAAELRARLEQLEAKAPADE